MQNEAQLILKEKFAYSPGVNRKLRNKTLTWVYLTFKLKHEN